METPRRSPGASAVRDVFTGRKGAGIGGSSFPSPGPSFRNRPMPKRGREALNVLKRRFSNIRAARQWTAEMSRSRV